MSGEFFEALQQIAKEKDIPLDMLIETVESALATAYKKTVDVNGEIYVTIDENRSAAVPYRVFTRKMVVEEVTNEHEEIALADALRTHPETAIGEEVTFDVEMKDFGRIAAQTAKQVVVQRIREAERRKIFDEYSERIGEVVTGTVQRREGRNIVISLGKIDAMLPAQEQVESEPYRFNDRIKIYVLDVLDTNKGPQVVVSRTHPSLIRRLFELEVPEIADGTVTIKSVAREPGARSKIAVTSRDEKVDPVGSCVGHRGSRVQAVVNELYDEKIDIVRWNESMALFIGEALSPAKSVKVTIKDDEKSAFVTVPDTQLSLAIGKAGQNVRLAARLTGWRIDIRSEAQVARATLMSMTDSSLDEDDTDEETNEVSVDTASETDSPTAINTEASHDEAESSDPVSAGSDAEPSADTVPEDAPEETKAVKAAKRLASLKAMVTHADEDAAEPVSK